MIAPRRPVTGRLVFICALVGLASCSAAGLELPNYGFYGFAPRPDGALLAPGTSAERVSGIEGDTAVVAEGTVTLDTTRMGPEGGWILARRTPMLDGSQVEDSVWLDRWSLRTIATWRRDASGEYRMRLNRRAVQIERRGINGRTLTRNVLLQAEPYALAGIDLILSTLPLSSGYNGSLPMVLESTPDELQWMKFVVSRGESLVMMQRGSVSFRPTWLIVTELAGVTRRYWVAGDDRAVLRREEPAADGSTVRLVRGGKVPRVELAPVEALPLN